jgi:hypothetical protein
MNPLKIARKTFNKISLLKNRASIIHSLSVLAGNTQISNDFKPVKGIEEQYKKLQHHNISIENIKIIIQEMSSLNEKSILSGKKHNGKIENFRLDFLVNTPTYKNRILSEVSNITGKKAISLQKLGNRSYADFVCKMDDGQEIGIEAKGFKGKRIIDTKRPWHNTTPQLANCSKEYEFDITFVDYWYSHILPIFKNKFQIKQEIPEKSTWIKKDALKHGSCETDFSKELKDLYNTNKDVKKRISEMFDEVAKLRIEKMTEQEKIDFGKITKNKLNKKLSGKPLWLNVSYDKCSSIIPSEETFSLVETPKIDILEVIGHAKMRKSHVIKFKYTTTKSNGKYYEGEARPRFRNTTGIANFGWNIKPY